MIFNIQDALIAIGGKHNCGLTYDSLEWLDEEIPKPTEGEINAKIAELKSDYDAKQYQRDRLAEYPSIQECIHAILDDDLEALQAKRSAVKAKYPKPE